MFQLQLVPNNIWVIKSSDAPKLQTSPWIAEYCHLKSTIELDVVNRHWLLMDTVVIQDLVARRGLLGPRWFSSNTPFNDTGEEL